MSYHHRHRLILLFLLLSSRFGPAGVWAAIYKIASGRVYRSAQFSLPLRRLTLRVVGAQLATADRRHGRPRRPAVARPPTPAAVLDRDMAGRLSPVIAETGGDRGRSGGAVLGSDREWTGEALALRYWTSAPTGDCGRWWTADWISNWNAEKDCGL